MFLIGWSAGPINSHGVCVCVCFIFFMLGQCSAWWELLKVCNVTNKMQQLLQKTFSRTFIIVRTYIKFLLSRYDQGIVIFSRKS